MGIFDILSNPLVRETLGTLVTQAGSGGLKNVMRQVAPAGAGKSMLGAGALGALMGTMLPKGMTKTAGIVGLGALAWNFYQTWSQQQKTTDPRNSGGGVAGLLNALGGNIFSGEAEAAMPQTVAQTNADPAAMLLLRAMIFSARADGHIDQEEENRILVMLQQLCPGEDVSPLLKQLLNEPLDPTVLARGVRSAEQADDLYRLSCMVIDIDNLMERNYLDSLAQAMHIDASRKISLEQEAERAKQQLNSL